MNGLESLKHVRLEIALSVQIGVLKIELLGRVFGFSRVIGAMADFSGVVLDYGEVKFTDAKGPGTPATKTLTVTRAAGKLKITNVSTSNPNFTAKFETMTPEQQYKVLITFTPPTLRQTKQTETGEMIIKTDDPAEPVLRVQLVARAM